MTSKKAKAAEKGKFLTRDNLLRLAVFGVAAICIVIWFNQYKYIQPNNSIMIPKPFNEDRSFEAVINLYSFTFGAQSPIDVYVTLYPDPQSMKEYLTTKTFTGNMGGIGLPPKYYMLFEGSFCDTLPKDENEKYKQTHGCILILPYDEELHAYRNNTTSRYPVEGQYGILLNETMPTRTNVDSITHKFIRIAPLESTVNDINAKAILTLTVIGTYLGALTIHFQTRKS